MSVSPDLQTRTDFTSGTRCVAGFLRVFERPSRTNNPVMKEFSPSQASTSESVMPHCRRAVLAPTNRDTVSTTLSPRDPKHIRAMAPRSLAPSDIVGNKPKTLWPPRSQIPQVGVGPLWKRLALVNTKNLEVLTVDFFCTVGI